MSAQELRAWDSYVTSGARSGELRLSSAVHDPALPQRDLERFQQFYRGVPIWGSDIVRDSQAGVSTSIFGELAQNLSIEPNPSLSLDDARAALTSVGGTNGALLKDVELVIIRLDSGEYRLAYTAVVSGDISPTRFFIDADTAAELLRISEIETQSAVGTGTGVLGDTKKISVLKEGANYVADDRLRPPVLLTYDMRGNLSRAMSVVQFGAALLPSDRASDGDNTWTDVAQVDAHVHVGWTYDYYFKRFGRRGLDDHDRPIRSITNAVSQNGAVSVPSSLVTTWVVQAFWCGACGPGPSGVMFFGNGIPATFTFGGQHYTYVAGGLDVVAHELSHGVTESTSNLVYRNESGALNESFSDVMGTSVEFFYQPAGDGPGRADYLIGEDVVTGPGASNGVRSLENPALYGQPDHYSKRFLGSSDDGGVHTNSGIPNNAFYLAIEGGTNRTSRISVQGVGGANRAQIEKVFYRAFAFLLPSSATFSTARAATIQAARDLYGVGSAPETAVTQAWTAVGVN
jgi:thermolysin